MIPSPPLQWNAPLPAICCLHYGVVSLLRAKYYWGPYGRGCIRFRLFSLTRCQSTGWLFVWVHLLSASELTAQVLHYLKFPLFILLPKIQVFIYLFEQKTKVVVVESHRIALLLLRAFWITLQRKCDSLIRRVQAACQMCGLMEKAGEKCCLINREIRFDTFMV